MSKTVCNICNQIKAVSLRITEDLIHCADHNLDKIYVLPLIEATDIISLGNLSLVEYHINRSGVILNEKPVTYVLTLSIYRKRLAVTYIIDKQWN